MSIEWNEFPFPKKLYLLEIKISPNKKKCSKQYLNDP